MPAGRLSTSKPLYSRGGGGVIVAFLVPITVLLSAFIVPFFWFAPAWRPEGRGMRTRRTRRTARFGWSKPPCGSPAAEPAQVSFYCSCVFSLLLNRISIVAARAAACRAAVTGRRRAST